MLDWLINLDRFVFLKINKDWSNTLFDHFFPAITDLHKTWFFQFIFLPWFLLTFCRQYGWRGLALIVGVFAAAGTSDFIGGQVVKPTFERLRPSHAEGEAIVRAPEYGGFSFTSNHAANTFAVAVFASFWLPQGRFIFLTLAFLVAYSRVYVGVHYPFDVLFGASLGALIGYLWARVMEKAIQLRSPRVS